MATVKIDIENDIKPRVLALGAMTLCWNNLEVLPPHIFANVFRLPQQSARIITHDLSMPTIWAKIVALLDAQPLDPETDSALRYGNSLFDLNRQNRNVLTHFMPANSSDGLVLLKTKGVNPLANQDGGRVPSDTQTIERVVSEIQACNVYLWAIMLRLNRLSRGRQPQPLPDRPPLPTKLAENRSSTPETSTRQKPSRP